MDNMENINSNSNNATKKWLTTLIVVLIMIIISIIIHIAVITTIHDHGTLTDQVLYLNYEKVYVYDSVNSALTDTKCQDGPPKPLKEILPELLKNESLVYLEGTTVGISIDQQITQEEISDKRKEDRIIYKIGDYFLAESIVQPN